LPLRLARGRQRRNGLAAIIGVLDAKSGLIVGRAIEQLVRLFGSGAMRHLKPLIASDWARTVTIGGAYSHAFPGRAYARVALARPLEDRLFFGGEATHTTDFSTAHGAYQSGVRAAEEVIAALAPSLVEHTGE